MIITRPNNIDTSQYYYRYLSLVDGNDLLFELQEIEIQTLKLVRELTDIQLQYAYLNGKWTIARLLQHICDAERIFAYRALRFLRADNTILQGFDEDYFAENGGIEYSTIQQFEEEYQSIRKASICLFQNADLKNLDFEGDANGLKFTPRLIGWLMVGHNLHHLNILKERYL